MINEFLESCRAYEIYPVSFCDSNGDGWGDLRGIINKLDYLADLQVNLIWINPCFEGPFRDAGYDITNYYKIDPRFGTNEDMAELFAKAKEKGIRIMLDLVMGHTSDQHPWFLQSSKAQKNEFTDTYIWNNAFSPNCKNDQGTFLCGCAERPESYRVNYYAHQPALNYGYYKPALPWQSAMDSPEALKNRQRVVDVIKFWLKMGASGYRVDMAPDMVKNDVKHRGNVAFWKDVIGQVRHTYPEAIFMPEWGDVANAVGRAGFDMAPMWGGFVLTPNNAYEIGKVYFTDDARGQLFIFLMDLVQKRRLVKGKGYLNLIPSCHDYSRINKGYSEQELKVIHAFLRTMPVLSFCYFGEEIGIPARPVPTRDAGYERTNARTPMQWDDSKNLGFSTGDTIYLPVEAPGTTHTVAAQEKRPDSLLHTVRALNHLKADYACFRLSAGFKVLKCGKMKGYPFVFERRDGGSRAVVVISPENRSYSLPMKKYGIDNTYHTLVSGAKYEEGRFTTQGPSFGVFVK